MVVQLNTDRDTRIKAQKVNKASMLLANELVGYTDELRREILAKVAEILELVSLPYSSRE